LNGLTTAELGAYACDKKKGLYPCGGVSDPVWEQVDWTKTGNSAESSEYAEILSNIGANPRYIIEKLDCVKDGAGACTAKFNYRITARANGGSTDAVVIVQSIFQI